MGLTTDSFLDWPIGALLPHRQPFLFLTNVQQYEMGKLAIARAHLPVEHPIASAHFPGHPIVPGAVLVEMVAQTSALLIRLDRGGGLASKHRPKPGMLLGIDRFRFRHQATPGEIFQVHAEHLESLGNTYRLRGGVTRNGKLLAEGNVLIRVVETATP